MRSRRFERYLKIASCCLVIFLILPLVSGCAATGAATPEKLTQRFFDAVFDADGAAVMDCVLPSLSRAYNAASSLTLSLTGLDPDQELAKEFAEDISELYGITISDISQVKNQTLVISQARSENTATLRTLVFIQIGDKYDYAECYVICNLIGGKWYFADLRPTMPHGYIPTEEMIPAAMLDVLLAKLNEKRLEYYYGVKFKIDDTIMLDDGRTVDLAMLEATWKEIDAYKKQGNSHLFSMYLTPNDPYPPYYFEMFVLEYQNDPLMRASVALTQGVSGFKNTISDLSAAFFDEANPTPLINLLEKDANVAQLIIDYLSSVEPGAKYQNPQCIVKTARESVDIVKMFADKAASAGSGTTTEELLKALEKMKLWTAVGNHPFVLGDVLELTEDNGQDVADKLFALADRASGSCIEFNVLESWPASFRMPFCRRLSELTRRSSNKSLYAYVDEEIAQINTNQKWEKFRKKVKNAATIFSGVVSSAEEYLQLIRYQEVLDGQEAYLRNILEYADCDNAEKIVGEVMRVLNETVAAGVVETLADGFLSDTIAATISSNVTDEMIEQALRSVVSKANVYMTAYEWCTTAAMLICDASSTKLQVWNVEDGYAEFQNAKQQLKKAMEQFYVLPTASNYVKLYYSAQYYGLLARSGSNKVSEILCADAESWMSKFLNLFDGSKVDQRLERLNDARQIPAKDCETLNRFLTKLFP